MKWILLICCLAQTFLLNAQSAGHVFDQLISRAADSLHCADPDEENPVSLNAQTVTDHSGDSVAVIIKARMAPGWHLYAYVPANMPYIPTECVMRPDSNVNLVGEWQKSRPIASIHDKGVLIYEDEVVFTHKLKRASKLINGLVSAGLYYQTCNLQQCLPPVERMIELKY